jgi:hypothetical protein
MLHVARVGKKSRKNHLSEPRGEKKEKKKNGKSSKKTKKKKRETMNCLHVSDGEVLVRVDGSDLLEDCAALDAGGGILVPCIFDELLNIQERTNGSRSLAGLTSHPRAWGNEKKRES